MRSCSALVAIAVALVAGAARAEGFAVERLRPSPPGAGWVALDALDLRGGLGGAIALSGGYARAPLRVGGVPVVANQAFVDVAGAVTWDRFRLHLGVTGPLLVTGEGARAAGASIAAPDVRLGSHPDTISDLRVGATARVLGGGGFRLGASAELWVPSGDRADYLTDGTYRGVLASAFAGDSGFLTYAGQLGVHLRPRAEAGVPGAPRGSELVFGLAAGARASFGPTAVVVGPELFGATALRAAFGADTTGVEGLVSVRVEGTADEGANVRTRVGVGAGLDPRFGAPEWRMVFGVELFGRSARPR
jgi:hypothetical protein